MYAYVTPQWLSSQINIADNKSCVKLRIIISHYFVYLCGSEFHKLGDEFSASSDAAFCVYAFLYTNFTPDLISVLNIYFFPLWFVSFYFSYVLLSFLNGQSNPFSKEAYLDIIIHLWRQIGRNNSKYKQKQSKIISVSQYR